ncbi:MAG: ERCC4 domain-containing protein [Candidatus Odinarchaeia archaeon]
MSKLFIYIDNREEPSGIPEKLRSRGILVYPKNLTVADYIISERCAVERKTISDFLASLFDGRLIDQFERLANTYNIPVLIIEGDQSELFSDPRFGKLFLKLLVELSLEYQCRIIPTIDKELTVEVLVTLLQYEQLGRLKHPITRRKPKTLSKKELAKFILMGFPSIGDKLSENLLKKFGSLKNIFSASKSEIARTKGVGKRLAEQIFDILEYNYYKKTDNKSIEQMKLGNV